MNSLEYKIPPQFDGDGRKKIGPVAPILGAQSQRLSRSSARMLTKVLYANRRSAHSDAATTLWVAIEALHYNRTHYRLTRVFGMGWLVEITEGEGP